MNFHFFPCPSRRGGALVGLTLGFLAVSISGARAETFVVSNRDDAGAGSLRQAILDANAAPGADVIDASATGGLITLRSELPALSDVTLVGSSQNRLSVFGNDRFRVFEVSGGNVVLAGLAVLSGRADIGGGILQRAGRLTLLNVFVNGNSATGDAGGGVYSEGTMVARDCVFAGNSAVGGNGAGGAIFLEDATLELSNCTFDENRARRIGGAIEVRGTSRVTVSGGSFLAKIWSPSRTLLRRRRARAAAARCTWGARRLAVFRSRFRERHLTAIGPDKRAARSGTGAAPRSSWTARLSRSTA